MTHVTALLLSMLLSPAALATTCTADVSLADHSASTAVGSIAYCIASLGTDGGTVYLPGDDTTTYKLLDPITLSSNITLSGDGPATSRLEYTDTDGRTVLTNRGAALSSVTITGLSIIGDGASAGQTCLAITKGAGASASTEIIVRDVVIQECGNYGAYFNGADGVLLDQVAVQDSGASASSGFGVYLYKVTNAQLEDVYVSRAEATGVQIYLSRNVLLRDVVVADNGLYGVRARASDYVKLANITSITNTQDGVSFTAPSSDDNGHLCLQNSAVVSNLTYGINVRYTTAYELTGNTVMGNTVEDTAVDTHSTEVAGTCDLIPEDESVFPFTR